MPQEDNDFLSDFDRRELRNAFVDTYIDFTRCRNGRREAQRVKFDTWVRSGNGGLSLRGRVDGYCTHCAQGGHLFLDVSEDCGCTGPTVPDFEENYGNYILLSSSCDLRLHQQTIDTLLTAASLVHCVGKQLCWKAAVAPSRTPN